VVHPSRGRQARPPSRGEPGAHGRRPRTVTGPGQHVHRAATGLSERSHLSRPSGRHPGGMPGRNVGLGWSGSDADQAVAALYHAHYASLARIAALLVGDGLAAEEMVQDAFASVYRAWRHLRGGEMALDYLRRAVVSRARSHPAASPGPRGRAGAGQASPAVPGTPVLTTLRGLPARQREALVLKYYADWPDRQIAAAMGISARALHAHIRRGLSALERRTSRAAVSPVTSEPGDGSVDHARSGSVDLRPNGLRCPPPVRKEPVGRRSMPGAGGSGNRTRPPEPPNGI
jgi:DNA-directed RNA polymerase specialized sigma24 family protein